MNVDLYSPQQIKFTNLIVNKNARTIEIKGITKEMEGQYVVSVSNSYGSENDYFTLNVNEQTAPKIFVTETIIRTDENTAIKIEPKVQYAGRPYFTWTKDNGPLPSNVQINGFYVLNIPQVKKENEGVYALTLSDEYGTARIQVRVFVEQRTTRRPSSVRRIAVKKNMDIELSPGETAHLLCNLKPSKQFNTNLITATSWFKGSTTQNEKFPTNVRPNQEQLQIIKFKPSNAGQYTCSLSSRDGTLELVVVNLIVKSESERPTVVISEKNKELNVGDNYEMNCTTSLSGNVEWLFNNNKLTSDTSYLFPRGNILYIRDAQLDLNGYFTCRVVSAEDGQYVEDSTRLTVKEKVPDVQLTALIAPQSADSYVGGSIKFICSLTDQSTGRDHSTNVRITWTKQNDRITSNQRQNENGEIVLYNLEEKDTGYYVCTTQHLTSGQIYQAIASLKVNPLSQTNNQENKVGEEEDTAVTQLVVDVSPKEVTLIQGRDAVFICTVKGGGNNKNKVEWTKMNGESLDPKRHIINGLRLEIKNVQPEDRGYFKCEATYGSESTNDYVRVDVESREAPKLEIYPMEDEVQVDYGSDAYAQCRVTAGIPTPSIEWKRADGRPLSSKIEITLEGTLLRIQNAGKQEFGSYICIAKNEEGVASDQIDFVGPNDESTTTRSTTRTTSTRRLEEEEEKNQPEVYIQNNLVEVNEGDTATFNCYVKTNSKYSIQWTNPSGNYLSTQNNNDGRLVLNNVQHADSGMYACVVLTSYGTNRVMAELKVINHNNKQPLKVQVLPKSRSVYPGNNVEFRCNVEDKDPLIRWSRSGNLALPKTSSFIRNILRIQNVSKEDEGSYRCTVKAANDERVAFDSAYLQIIDKNTKTPFPVYIKVIEAPTYVSSGPAYKYGVKITAECVVLGRGIEDITWSKLEGGVNRASYQKSNNKNVMTLEALVPMDLGSYVCIATRNDGERAQNTIVFSRRSDYGNHFEYKIDGPSEPSEEDENDNNNNNNNDNERSEEIVTQGPTINDQETAPESKILEGDRLVKNEG